MTELKGQWALVTGASSGIGADIARELARHGANLVLVARREQRLLDLATELRRDFGVDAEAEVCDLLVPEAPRELFKRLTDRGREIPVLVNNAGFGLHGDFVEQDPDRIGDMIQLNMVAVTQMTRFFAEAMVGRGGGMILQVASNAALVPLPSYSIYGATKAYVLAFSEAIYHELRPKNVSVTTLMPGVTWTEFFDVSGQKPPLYNRIVGMSSGDVAKIGVRAMLRRRSNVIAGWRNWVTMTISATIPRPIRSWFSWQMMTRG